MIMHILITGVNGQLGQELVRVLKSGQTELGSVPEPFKNCRVAGIDIDDLDITDLPAVKGFIRSGGYDVIINCAAYTNVNKCETDRDTAFKANALGPRNLAIAAQEIDAKLVHVSTDYVFPGDGYVPYIEGDVPFPHSMYGRTKLLGEQYVRDFCSRYFIVRTAWLYGYKGNNFVKTIMKNAREKGELKVVSDQRGNPTNAADLAHHLLKAAASEQYGIYHCTGNGECSWYDFACRIVEYAGISCKVSPCTTDEYPTPAKRPAYSSLDNMMLRCTVGDEMRQWEQALKYFIDHLQEN